jgi:hypothetical protein
MTSIREEVDCLSLKKKFLDTGTLLTLKQPAYVCRLSKGRARMYACRPTTSYTHLCNFSKKNINRQTDRAGRTGMAPTGDQNPLKTHKLTENSKR